MRLLIVRKSVLSISVIVGGVLLFSFLGALSTFAQSEKVSAPVARMSATGKAEQPSAPPLPTKGVPGLSSEAGSRQKTQKALQAGGCASACPKCLRTCVLNVGHYGPHECSEGHTWDGHDSQRPSPCISACPVCLRSCVLNFGHYSPHECSEGHTWN